jgi:hypothetical protein
MSRLDEKRFTALGVEWTARFSFNATCAVEDDTGESFYAVAAPFLTAIDKDDADKPEKVLAMLGTRKNSVIRLLLFHALADAHEITLEQAGDIIQDMGLKGATEIVLWAIGKALGAGDEGAEGNAPKTPAAPNRKARRAAVKLG